MFLSHPSRNLKAHQIKTILEYNGIEIKYGIITKKLDIMVTTTILGKIKRGKVYSYFLITDR